jgi:phage gp29-like protein
MNLLTLLREVIHAVPHTSGSISPLTSSFRAGFLTPQVRAHWQAAGLSWYTPQTVEAIARQAAGGDLVGQWELFDLMEATWPQLNKNLNELKEAVVTLDWNLQPWAAKGREPSAESQQRAALVEEALWGMRPAAEGDENGFEETIYDLLDARGKGLSVLEVDWESREQKADRIRMGGAGPSPVRPGAAPGSSLIVPRSTRWVHPSSYGYDSDGRLKLRLDRETAAWSNRAGTGRWRGSSELTPFPADKFIIGVCKSRTGSPLGSALLRTLGFWWAATNLAAGWFLDFAQVFGHPVRWATFDPSASAADKATLAEMLADMKSSAWGMFPSGTQLELKEAVQSAGENPHKVLLEFANKQCDLLILRQTLSSDVGPAGSGSRALGEVHERVLGSVKLALANWAARILNQQLLPAICRQNFGDDSECPFLVPALKETRDRKATAEGLLAARQAGLSLPRAWAHEQLDVPQPGPGDDVIEPAGGRPGSNSEAAKTPRGIVQP